MKIIKVILMFALILVSCLLTGCSNEIYDDYCKAQDNNNFSKVIDIRRFSGVADIECTSGSTFMVFTEFRYTCLETNKWNDCTKYERNKYITGGSRLK